MRYDVVIAGLGPAGAVAAWHLSRMGFRVAGVDMRSWDNLWGKPCGDAIGAHHVTAAGLGSLPSRAVKSRVTAIDIYSPGETVRYRVHGEGFIINRKALGEHLVREAIDNGAEIMLNTFVLGPIIEGGRVTGIRVRDSNGTVREIRGRLVIEATGFSRAIRSKLPRDWLVSEPIEPADTNIAYREIIRYEDYSVDEPNVIRIYIDQDIAPGGYWWYFPESSSSVNAGLGVQGGKGYPSPQTLYRELTRKHPLFQHNYRVVTGAGAPLPTRRPSNTMVGPGIVVIGDAGYTVNPLHGGGMGYAFQAAYMTARAFEDAYNADDLTVKGLWAINLEYMKAIGAKQAALDVFRIFLQRLSNEDIRFGMEKKLIPEQDVYYTSSEGDIKISAVEKAGILLRGLRRPTLLAKLKIVADYMKNVKKHYLAYPENPEELPRWIDGVEKLYQEYISKLG